MNRSQQYLMMLLIMTCLYQTWMILDLKSSQTGTTDEMLNEHLQNCIDAAVQAGVNDVPGEVLRSELLDDAEEIRAYVEDFDLSLYEEAAVHGIGRFYLDEQADWIKDVLRQGQIWEPLVVARIMEHARPGTTAIDAGAHIGTHTVLLSRHVGPNGRVYAFEPQKKIYRELVHNMRLNQATNVVPLRFAVGDAHGVIEMEPAATGNEGGTPRGEGGDAAELRTIDSFGFNNVSLVKIDVEHMEDQVIDGARDTIARNRPVIIVEIQGGVDYDKARPEYREKIEHTVNKLVNLGYNVSRFSTYDYLGIPAEQEPGGGILGSE